MKYNKEKPRKMDEIMDDRAANQSYFSQQSSQHWFSGLNISTGSINKDAGEEEQRRRRQKDEGGEFS